MTSLSGKAYTGPEMIDAVVANIHDVCWPITEKLGVFFHENQSLS